ncbi:hypothetical protein Scep_011971 [Stephania cephalantha]|uniref:Protein kinase domain-containing protein n=1 Tax=Stephania cephalantha TaxID=152367 RepID=A0AAP0P6C1_9MAGN
MVGLIAFLFAFLFEFHVNAIRLPIQKCLLPELSHCLGASRLSCIANIILITFFDPSNIILEKVYESFDEPPSSPTNPLGYPIARSGVNESSLSFKDKWKRGKPFGRTFMHVYLRFNRYGWEKIGALVNLGAFLPHRCSSRYDPTLKVVVVTCTEELAYQQAKEADNLLQKGVYLGYAPPTDSSNYRSAKVVSFLDAGLMSIARCAELSVLRLAIFYNFRGNDPIQVGKFCHKLIELNLYSSLCEGELFGADLFEAIRLFCLIKRALQILISDFGLAKMMPENQEMYVTTKVLGTFGYFDLEYTSTGKLTIQSNVYAFGVVLLELLTRRRAVDLSQGPNDQNLVLQVRHILTDRKKLRKVIDPDMNRSSYNIESITMFANLASHCVRAESTERHSMTDCVKELQMTFHLYFTNS